MFAIASAVVLLAAAPTAPGPPKPEDTSDIVIGTIDEGVPLTEPQHVATAYDYRCNDLVAKARVVVTRTGVESVYLAVNGREIPESVSGEARQWVQDAQGVDYVSFSCRKRSYTFGFAGHVGDEESRYFYITGVVGKKR